jgi:hypothetical protein
MAKVQLAVWARRKAEHRRAHRQQSRLTSKTQTALAP